MAARGFLHIALGLTLAVASPALAPVLGPIVGGAALAAAPSSSQIAADVTAAVNDVKASDAYKSATVAEKALMLANAVKGVIATALGQGATSASIGSAMNTVVTAGTVNGSIAVEGAALAAVQVTQAGGAGASEAAGLAVAVQQEPAVSANIAATGGNQAAVTAVNSSGQTITVLVPLSTVLTAAAGGNLTSGGTITGTTNGTGGTNSPCSGVLADYC